MRYAEGLHPVWGFLAPPKRFTRTIRIVIIAAVLGAAAGSFSLIEHSRDETSVAARTLVTQQPPSTLLSAQEKSQASSKASRPSQLCRPCVLTPPTWRTFRRRRTRSTKLDRITRRLDTCSVL